MALHKVFVDDNPSMRLIAKAAAVKAGVPLTIFADGKEALEGIRGMHGPVVVLSDLVMPKMNGLELAKGLTTREKTTIYLCTNLPEVSGGEHGQQPDMPVWLTRMATEAGVATVYPKRQLFQGLQLLGIDSSNFNVLSSSSAEVFAAEPIQNIFVIEGLTRLTDFLSSVGRIPKGSTASLVTCRDNIVDGRIHYQETTVPYYQMFVQIGLGIKVTDRCADATHIIFLKIVDAQDNRIHFISANEFLEQFCRQDAHRGADGLRPFFESYDK